MKIVHLIAYFQPKLGYQEFFLAREMQRLGHKVNVVTSNYYFPFPDYINSVYKILGERQTKVGVFRERGVTVYRLPIYYQSKSGAVVILKNLNKAFLKLKPDVVYCDGVFSPLSVLAAYYKDKVGYKLFYDNHASSFNTNLRDSLIKRIYMFVFKIIFISYIKKKADGFSAVGDSEKHLLCKEYGLKSTEVKLIRLGADTMVFCPDRKKRVKTRAKLKVAKTEVLVLYAGKLTRNKDLDVLVRAFVLSLGKIRNMKLLIVGGGDKDYIDTLKLFAKRSNIEDKIIWYGPVENKSLTFFFNAADVGIWPGDPSNIIFEALACGLPVILPEKPSRGDTSSHFLAMENGFAFKRKNYKQLSGLIIKLSQDKRLREEMSNKSRQLIVNKYSWEKIAKKFLELV